MALNKTETTSMSISQMHISGSLLSPNLDKASAAPPSGSSEKKYKLYPFRWVMQLFVLSTMIVSGFLMVGFSPIASTIAKIYGCNEVLVQIQTIIFLAAFIPGNFIVIGVLNKYGLRVAVS